MDSINKTENEKIFSFSQNIKKNGRDDVSWNLFKMVQQILNLNFNTNWNWGLIFYHFTE